MAYMSQEQKAVIQSALKNVIPKTWKWSLSVHNHSTLVLTIAKADVDLLGELQRVYTAQQRNNAERFASGYADLNPYWFKEQLDQSLPLFESIFAALNIDNYNNSDLMTDYHNVGHYVDVKIGRWNKPFEFTGTVNA